MTGYESKKTMARVKLAQEPINVRVKFLAENILESIDCWDAAGAKATLEMLTALAQPEQEPVAWTLLLTSENTGLVGKAGEKFVGAPNYYQRVNVYTNPPQPAQDAVALRREYQSGYYDGKQAALAGREWNFCERCGKRTADLTVIHTCTPPQENT